MILDIDEKMVTDHCLFQKEIVEQKFGISKYFY